MTEMLGTADKDFQRALIRILKISKENMHMMKRHKKSVFKKHQMELLEKKNTLFVGKI